MESGEISGEASGPSGVGFLHKLREAVYSKGQTDLQMTYPDSKRYVHTDCNDLMESWVGKQPDQKNDYGTQLKKLHDKIVQATGGLHPNEPTVQRNVPASSGVRGMQVMVPLYQLGYEGNMGIKGPSAATDVFDCVHKFLLGVGNETHLYPVQVLYDMNVALKVGDPVEHFSVGLNVGFAVATACHMICHTFLSTTLQEDWMSDSWWNQEEHAGVLEKMRAILRLSASWSPGVDLEDQVFKAISSKKHASVRQAANLIQLMFACQRIITHKRNQGSRKTAVELINEWLKNYNKKETTARCKLNADEQKGLKLLIRMSEEFINLLKTIWNADKLHRTAVPLNLLCEKFLAVDAEPPVRKDDNPMWYGICSQGPDKYLAWLLRCNGKFDHSLDQALQLGEPGASAA